MEGRDRDFLPLTVEYREKAYAGGRIPGGFFKREGRPDEKETLTCRLIDRPLRPLFPKGFRNELQIINLVISADDENDPDVLALVGSSAAVALSGIPVRRGRSAPCASALVDGRLVANPTYKQLAASPARAGHRRHRGRHPHGRVRRARDQRGADAGGPRLRPRASADAWRGSRRTSSPRRASPAGSSTPRRGPTRFSRRGYASWPPPRSSQALSIHEKQARAQAMEAHLRGGVGGHRWGRGRRRSKAREYFDKVEKAEVRRLIVDKGIRVDGRSVTEVRPIWSEVGYLPRAHGSALFTRGETQALVAATLGTKNDEQKIESFEGDTYRRFMLHYNFPSFSTGEVKRFGTPGRREIGHGALAQRAIEAVLPTREAFPYTVRVVSEILESNGSSSMATVCGASMALMDAGVPIAAPVAGIAMGLVKDGDKVGILTDIMGTEDHYGDMDFKVAGTDKGSHRAADGHQDRRRLHRHHAPGPRPGARGAASRARGRWRRRSGRPARR